MFGFISCEYGIITSGTLQGALELKEIMGGLTAIEYRRTLKELVRHFESNINQYKKQDHKPNYMSTRFTEIN